MNEIFKGILWRRKGADGNTEAFILTMGDEAFPILGLDAVEKHFGVNLEIKYLLEFEPIGIIVSGEVLK